MKQFWTEVNSMQFWYNSVYIIADVLLCCCGPASESTNRRLIIYTVVEYVCLVGVSLGQVYLIRKLFDKRLGYNRV